MTKLDKATQDRILSSTVKMLLTQPVDKITIRAIAKDSKVNVAAINYHFRSKDELIDRAIGMGTGQAFENGLKVLFAAGKPARQRLTEFMTGYAKGLMEFPGLTRTAFLKMFLKEAEGSPYGKFTFEMLSKVAVVIGEINKEKDEKTNLQDSLILISSIIFPFVVSNTIKSGNVLDYTDPVARAKYIQDVIKSLTN